MRRNLFVSWSIAFLSVTWWCRVEPIVRNGDDYIVRGDDIKEICKEALNECFEQYGVDLCEITNCGNKEDELYISMCSEMYN